MSKLFNNNASNVRFIGNRQLENVIAEDRAELAEVNGSFEAIATRMKYFMDFVDYDNNYDYATTIGSRMNLGRTDATLYALFGTLPPKTHRFTEEKYEPQNLIEGIYRVWDMSIHNGNQGCPFSECRAQSGRNVILANMKTDRVFLLSGMGVHLVEEHQLLEKDNGYGISAREFYEHFMPK